ncbi:MAG: PAS domain S-box protein [Syntrophales bacterium]|nr:PAS domain S-box protein [Syntrophales bacterium]
MMIEERREEINAPEESPDQNPGLKVLILGDVPHDAELMVRALRKVGISCTALRVDTREAFLKELAEFHPDLILSDYQLPAFDGLSALEMVKERCPDVPFIFVTGTIGEERAIETMRRGAANYVLKNKLAKLAPAVLQAVQEMAARKEHLRVLERLRESEEKYRLHFENVNDLIFSLDNDMKVFSVSPSSEKMLGYKPAELEGIPIPELNILTPSSLERAALGMKRILEGEPSESVPYEYFTKDGTKRFGEARSTPLFRDGKVMGAVAVVRDITERKAAEDEARLDLLHQKALLDLHQQMTAASIHEIIHFVVEKCVSLTESVIGFIGLISDDDKFMEAHLWSEKAMIECGINKATPFPVEQAGLWAEPIRQRRPVICNDYGAPESLKRGYPRGHIELTSYMGIPVMDKDRVVAIAGLGNKNQAYTDGDLRHVSLLVEGMWNLIKTKRADEARRKIMERLDFALTAANMGAWEWDLRSDQISGSSESRAILGLEGFRGKFSRDSFSALIAPEDAARVAAEARRALEERSSFRTEFRINRPDGRMRWVSDIGRGKYDDAGRAIGLIGVVQDVTERKRIEEELRREEDRHRTILRTAVDGICVMDMQGGLQEVNEAYCRMTGYSSQELLAMRISDLTTESFVDTAAHMNKIMALGGDRFESLHRRKDGTRCDVEVSVQYQAGEDGRLVCFVRDITKHKREEAELRWKTAFLEAQVEVASDGILVVDDRGKKILASRNFLDLMKVPQHIRDDQDDAPLLRYVMERVAHQDRFIERVRYLYDHPNETSQDEIEFKDGTILDRYSSPVLGEDGKYFGRIWSFRDVTARKQTEVKLRQQADAMDAAIDGMAILNKEGEYVYLNKAHARIYGYENAEALIRKSWRILYDSAALQRFDQEVMPAFGREGFWHGESTGMKKDGSKFPQDLSLTAMTDGGLICVVRDITDRKQAAEELNRTIDNLRKAIGTTIQVMVSAVEVRDPYTAGHQIRSADLARAIAMEMGLPQEKIEGIRLAGSIHDIGKLAVPAEMLSKPTKLTNIEFSLIKEHALKGYEMLKDVDSPWPLAQIVYQHHERMDGSGYPRNLKGNDILLEARILSVADVVESMASHRPYRPALGIDAALEEISKNRGLLYDPEVVDACLRLFLEKEYLLAKL